jgi:hypothetical protein
LGIQNGLDDLEGIGVDGRMILRWILGKLDGRVWIGFIWLMITSIDVFLSTWKLTFSLHKRRRIS